MKKAPKVGTLIAIEGSLGTYVVARVDVGRSTIAAKNTKDDRVLLNR
jgi:hypothetical protein